MGLKPDAPKAPDPTKTADAQLGYNTNAAQSTINMNSLDHSGPFGSSTFTHDANGNVTGQNVSLSDALQGGSNATQNAFSSQAGNINTGPINWDSSTVPSIVNSNYANYSNLVAPQQQQQQKQLDTTLSDRGIPIGSEVYNDAQGNLSNSFNLANSNAAAGFLNAAPGLQAQLQNNQIQQYNQPTNSAAGSLGLLQGLSSLNPAAPQGSASIGSPNYQGAVQDQYNAQMQQYQSEMGGINNLVTGGLGLLTAPMTGGTSLLGMGASKLFGGGSPTYASNGSFNLNNLQGGSSLYN